MGSRQERIGLKGLIRTVSAKGLRGVDARSAASRAVRDWRRALFDDLGGEANCSTQQRTLVDMASRSVLILNHIDAFLLETPTLLNRKLKKIAPIVLQRQTLADGLLRHLTALGLERRGRPLPSLAEYLSEKYSEGEEHAEVEPDDSRPDDGSGAVREDV
jgi:hypothetical protein